MLGMLVAVSLGREVIRLVHAGMVGASVGMLIGLAAGLGVYMTLGGDEG